jgi:hypothetical protein
MVHIHCSVFQAALSKQPTPKSSKYDHEWRMAEILNEAVVAYFKAIFQNFPELSQYSW